LRAEEEVLGQEGETLLQVEEAGAALPSILQPLLQSGLLPEQLQSQLSPRSLQMQEAYASKAIKKSKLKRKTAERKNIQSTLKSLKEYKDIIIEDEGEEEYKRQVRELLWKLRHGDVEEDLPPLIGKSNEGNDSEDDDGYNIDNANNFQVAPV
jgi:hypothetical protein